MTCLRPLIATLLLALTAPAFACEDELTSSPWWNRAQDGVRYRVMPAPYQRVYIGSDPRDGMTGGFSQTIDAFLNVSDTPNQAFLNPSPHKVHAVDWFPMDELAVWGYEPFYGAIKVLERRLARGETIYLHCHSGIHRSKVVFLVYLIYQGMSPVRAATFMSRTEDGARALLSLYENDIEDGHIPAHLPRYLQLMKEHPTYSVMGVRQMLEQELTNR